MSYPVFIQADMRQTGSGFIYYDSVSVFLVTAKHVLHYDDTVKKKTNLPIQKLVINQYPNDYAYTEKNTLNIDLQLARKYNYLIESKNKDMAIIYIGKLKIDSELSLINYDENIISKTKSRLSKLNPLSKMDLIVFDSVNVSNDAFIAGYPTDIKSSSNYHFDRPLLRKGIVSGKDIEFKKIIIDCFAYGGNSGGPVFMIALNNKKEIGAYIIGIAIEIIPYLPKGENLVNFDYQKTNTGLTVVEPIDELKYLIREYYIKYHK